MNSAGLLAEYSRRPDVAEDLKRTRYQLGHALAVDDPHERLSATSDNQPRTWQLQDRLSQADIALVIKDWYDGASQNGIAQKFGISQSSVSRLIAKYGKGSDNPREPNLIAERFSPQELDEIVAMYVGGMKQREVVARYGISASALKRMLKDRNARRQH